MKEIPCLNVVTRARFERNAISKPLRLNRYDIVNCLAGKGFQFVILYSMMKIKYVKENPINTLTLTTTKKRELEFACFLES